MPPVADPAEIRALLETDRRWSVYPLGDLAPVHFARSSWWRAPAPAAALALVYHAFEPHVLFLLGAAEHLPALLDEIGPRPAFSLHVRPEALPAIRSRYRIDWHRVMWRMVLDPARFPSAAAGPVVRLGPDDLEAVRRLYRDGDAAGEAPDFFMPELLRDCVFFGLREGDDLLCTAGTHLVVPAEGVAAVGNIYTRRDRRGRGLARQATAAVVAELLRRKLRTIALNVNQQNAPAIHVYERLGFDRYCEFVEGLAIRQENAS